MSFSFIEQYSYIKTSIKIIVSITGHFPGISNSCVIGVLCLQPQFSVPVLNRNIFSRENRTFCVKCSNKLFFSITRHIRFLVDLDYHIGSVIWFMLLKDCLKIRSSYSVENKLQHVHHTAGLNLSLGPADERRRYKVTPSRIESRCMIKSKDVFLKHSCHFPRQNRTNQQTNKTCFSTCGNCYRITLTGEPFPAMWTAQSNLNLVMGWNLFTCSVVVVDVYFKINTWIINPLL